MKSTLLIIALLFASNTLFAADTLSTDIKKATVFLSGAQVFRQSKTVSIKKPAIKKYAPIKILVKPFNEKFIRNLTSI